MRILVTVRHDEVPDGVRERTVELLRKAAKLASRPHRAEIVFNAERRQKVVELRLFSPRGKVHVAVGEAQDYVAASDRAIEQLRHQLDRGTTRTKRRVS